MKYFKRLKVYKASRVELDPETLKSYSYGWWQVTRKIGDKVFFNWTSYSNSTAKHQSKIRSVLRELGYNFDNKKLVAFQLRNRDNIRDMSDKQLVERIISDYKKNIQELLDYNQKPRVRKTTKEYNLERIESIKKEIEEIAQFDALLCFDNQLETLINDNTAA
jgi:hypothetical protein